MIDLTILQAGHVFWDDPIGWFLQLPLLFQIFIIIGLIALTIAALVLVYYILKGLTYLLYYIFKGLYYLFKGIFLGFYKLFEAFYHAISGKPKKNKQEISPPPEGPIIPREHFPSVIGRNEFKIPNYCTECGQQITESMSSLLISRGIGYCFYCGKEFKIQTA